MGLPPSSNAKRAPDALGQQKPASNAPQAQHSKILGTLPAKPKYLQLSPPPPLGGFQAPGHKPGAFFEQLWGNRHELGAGLGGFAPEREGDAARKWTVNNASHANVKHGIRVCTPGQS